MKSYLYIDRTASDPGMLDQGTSFEYWTMELFYLFKYILPGLVLSYQIIIIMNKFRSK